MTQNKNFVIENNYFERKFNNVNTTEEDILRIVRNDKKAFLYLKNPEKYPKVIEEMKKGKSSFLKKIRQINENEAERERAFLNHDFGYIFDVSEKQKTKLIKSVSDHLQAEIYAKYMKNLTLEEKDILIKKTNGEAFIYFEEFNDEETYKMVINTNPYLISDIPEEKITEEMIIFALRNTGCGVLDDIPQNKINRNIVDVVLENSPNFIGFLPKELLNEKDYLKSIKRDPYWTLHGLDPEDVKAEYVLLALKENPLMVTLINFSEYPEEVRNVINDEKVRKECLKNEPRVIFNLKNVSDEEIFYVLKNVEADIYTNKKFEKIINNRELTVEEKIKLEQDFALFALKEITKDKTLSEHFSLNLKLDVIETVMDRIKCYLPKSIPSIFLKDVLFNLDLNVEEDKNIFNYIHKKINKKEMEGLLEEIKNEIKTNAKKEDQYENLLNGLKNNSKKIDLKEDIDRELKNENKKRIKNISSLLK